MKKLSVTIFTVLLLVLSGCTEYPAETTSAPETTLAPGTMDTTQTFPVTLPPETVPTTTETEPLETLPPEPDQFVRVLDYIPNLVVELRYATENNFTGQVIYSFSDAYLRYGTVCKIMQVQAELEAMGLGLKLWDGFRPPRGAAQALADLPGSYLCIRSQQWLQQSQPWRYCGYHTCDAYRGKTGNAHGF